MTAETIIMAGLVGIIALGAIIFWHRVTLWLHATDDLWTDRVYLSKNK